MNITELKKLAQDDMNAPVGGCLGGYGEEVIAMIELLREMGECLLHCYAETDARINKRAAILAKFKEMTK
jgi:hypothetical protein